MLSTLHPFAQNNRARVDMELQPYKISRRDKLFKRNLSFAGYKTHQFRRNISSWFSFGTFNIKNEILKQIPEL